MKKREIVTAFDFENAFKALEEIEIPKVAKKQRDLSEHFVRSNVTNALMEDYYDVNNVNDLEQAQNSRQEEIAQAKLARIEKIVDINAESPEDILPSYVGKNIIQCPQCMTLFYKDPADIEISEEDEDICNVSEVCQHCGNDSGYTLIGKIEAVEDVEEEPQLDEVPIDQDTNQEEDSTENNDDVDSKVNDIEEEPVEDENEESLNIEPIGEEDSEEVKESLDKTLTETYWACAIVDGEERRYPFGTREEARQYISMIQNGEAKEFEGKKITSTWTESLREGVDKDLNDKLEAHNEYIEYLKNEIEKAEKEVENAKNEFVKKSIEARIDSLKTDLEAALPEALKDEVQNELPAADEIEEVKESLNEAIDIQKLYHEDIFNNPYTAIYVARKLTYYFVSDPDEAEKLGAWGDDGLEEYELPILGDLINDALVAGNWHEEAEEWGWDKLPIWWSDRCSSAQKADMDNYINACKNDDDRYHLLFLAINSLALEYGYEWYGFKESFNNVKKALTENLKEESAKELLQDFADSLGEELKESPKENDFEYTHEAELDSNTRADEISAEGRLAMPSDFEDVQAERSYQEQEESTVKIEEDAETEEKLDEFEKSLEESTNVKDNFIDDVSREEFKAMLNDPVYYESFEEDKDDFEELDECSLNEHISGYLTNVYENVKSFEATNCSYENNKLMIEGNINFNSGSINSTKFEFIKENNSFVGENKDLCEGLNFTLNYINKNKTIVTESFKYKYTIGKNLVEGIIKK